MYIGKATIQYSESGQVTNSQFTTGNLLEIPDIDRELAKIDNSNEEKMEEHAKFVMSAMFSLINEVELADQEQFKIVTKKDECEHYMDGTVKSVTFSFYQETI